MRSISRRLSIGTSFLAETIRTSRLFATDLRSSGADRPTPASARSCCAMRSDSALNPRRSATHKAPSASSSTRRSCMAPSNSPRRSGTPGRRVAAARRWQATVTGVCGSLARTVYMSRTTEAILDAASGSSRGSARRCVATTSGVAVSLGAPVMKNVSGGTRSQAHSRRKVARSGCPPASTRDSVMKLTSAASAALRIDKPADSRRCRSASANASELRCETVGFSDASSSDAGAEWEGGVTAAL